MGGSGGDLGRADQARSTLWLNNQLRRGNIRLMLGSPSGVRFDA
jgi:hypothetical protein